MKYLFAILFSLLLCVSARATVPYVPICVVSAEAADFVFEDPIYGNIYECVLPPLEVLGVYEKQTSFDGVTWYNLGDFIVYDEPGNPPIVSAYMSDLYSPAVSYYRLQPVALLP